MNKKVLSIELLFSIILIIVLSSTQETLEYYSMIDPKRYNSAYLIVNISFIIYAIVPVILSIYYKCRLFIWLTWITLFCFSISSIYLM